MIPEQIAARGSEHSHQAALFAWAALSSIPELRWMFAIPNGFYGSASQKGKMKAEGLKLGVWDVHLPKRAYSLGMECYNGLFIEMKHARHRNHKDGGLTDEQIEFRKDLQGEYAFAVCYSWIEAKEAVLGYLGRT